MIIKESFENDTVQPDFSRSLYNTIAEMKAVSSKKMPRMYIATCRETGKAYIYNKDNSQDEMLGLWREIAMATEPTEPTTKYTLYYGYINGTLDTTDKVTDEGFVIDADVLKALSSKIITSKSNSVTYIATEVEENALGQSFPTYAYPASLGELTTYTSLGTGKIEDSYTRFDIDIDGVAYYAYVQTVGHAPSAGDEFNFTYA